MQKQRCKKCGEIIQLPELPASLEDYPYREPELTRWNRKSESAVLRHAWDKHREDIPPEFQSFPEFLKWLYTPEGRAWDGKQGLLAQAEAIISGKGE